jgi:hypothetical protein
MKKGITPFFQCRRETNATWYHCDHVTTTGNGTAGIAHRERTALASRHRDTVPAIFDDGGSPLCPDSDRVPQRREMTRWAIGGRQQRHILQPRT